MNLIVSLPLSFIKNKHKSTTVLACKASTIEIGDIVWARAPMLPGWPGKIISSNSKRGLKKAPIGKVTMYSVVYTIHYVCIILGMG